MASTDDIDGIREKLARNTSPRGPLLFGLGVLACFATVFVLGGGLAPIEGAAVAHGNFVARSLNQTVQHFEGGIVSQILVKEGDLVKKGQVLVKLDTTQAVSDLARLTTEMNSGAARLARLFAEREKLDAIAYPEWLAERAKSDDAIAKLMEDQDKEFAARLKGRETKTAILNQKIKALEVQIEGDRQQQAALVEQQEIIVAQLESTKPLFDKGLVPAERYYRLQLQNSDVDSNRARLTSAIGAAQQEILENQQQIVSLHDESVETAATDIVDLRLQLAKTVADIASTSDILKRSDIIAPMDGTVVKRHVNTIGAVLRQGGDVAELLPEPADLVVEVRVSPSDIDRIHVGQDASVRVSALDLPYAPLMPGKVEYVSADRIVDSDAEQEYYVARISDVELPAGITGDHVYPGMQVESFIETGARTFAEYIFDPLWRSYTRSLRER